ncbi:hypothetical protein [Curtobacterium sp. RIT-PI-V]|uniref:hypothetical protein n=1 Tax=Curtobacterium sp. RIT-PI-V TaxID=3035296 RepID=UPI0021D96248|nr:hypothetical protein [Curtobacterium sp. RIT-PI-V]
MRTTGFVSSVRSVPGRYPRNSLSMSSQMLSAMSVASAWLRMSAGRPGLLRNDKVLVRSLALTDASGPTVALAERPSGGARPDAVDEVLVLATAAGPVSVDGVEGAESFASVVGVDVEDQLVVPEVAADVRGRELCPPPTDLVLVLIAVKRAL